MLGQYGEVYVSETLKRMKVLASPRISVGLSLALGTLKRVVSSGKFTREELEEIFSRYDRKKRYFRLKNGTFVNMEGEFGRLCELREGLGLTRTQLLQEEITLPVYRALYLDGELCGWEGFQVKKDRNFKALIRNMKTIEDNDFELPKSLEGIFREYQKTGFLWIKTLKNNGFAGILADEMGLGKTLQTISFLTSVAKKETKILILAPSSLIYNWKQEFSKFAPQMEVEVVYGLKQHRDELIATNPQVVITSYASFRQDVEEYQKNQYEYLILDEAQVMKNAQTKIAQHLRGFDVPHVFALSGTPIENHVGELWSIFQIVLPGLFPAKREFQKLSPETIARFVKPFVMRRKKDEVLQELPDLIETTYHNELDESQKTIYLAQLKQIQDRVRTSSEEELNRSKVEILSGLMRLRQICDTPALFMEDYQGDSGKLESLRDLLGQIKDGEHRVLIFSQFRGMLDILEQEIDQLGMTSFKITGSTPAKDRQEMTNAFNAGERHAFLISLKAGGVGLNLTGADTVILVDLWWNPAVEDQAIGRAHRMGQEQNVEVYRMITRGTIEEKIQELQASKRHLVSTILDGTETRSSLSVEEIREILGIQSE